MTIGTCDCCEAQNVEVRMTTFTGLEAMACAKCRGVDDDVPPTEPQHRRLIVPEPNGDGE